MKFDRNDGSIFFGKLQLNRWLGYHEILSMAEGFGYDITGQSESAAWSRFILSSKEEDFELNMVFSDLRLEFLHLCPKDDRRDEINPQYIFNLAKRLGLMSDTYPWGTVSIVYDDRSSGYGVSISFVR